MIKKKTHKILLEACEKHILTIIKNTIVTPITTIIYKFDHNIQYKFTKFKIYTKFYLQKIIYTNFKSLYGYFLANIHGERYVYSSF